MEPIKTSKNVEFDVIYADGTRHHVSEGVLFEVNDNKLTFHNGTDRPPALIGVAEAAAEVVGLMGLNEAERALIIYNIHKRIFGRNNAAADMKINAESYRKENEGEWKTTVLVDTPTMFQTGAPHCSECGKTAPRRTPFCPNCGAKMKGE